MSKLRAFTMPKWGIEMTEGRLGEWTIAEGDQVAKGQTLAQIETDKIVNEVQAEFDSKIARIIAVPGETYPVGALLAILAMEPASVAELEEFALGYHSSPGDPAPSRETAISGSAPKSATRAPRLDANLMSPAARDLAGRLGVDVAHIRGSGRRGRITLQDVDQASKPARDPIQRAEISVLPTGAAFDGFYATPMAKRLAVEYGVDLSKLTASGSRGRISRRDVALAAGVSPLQSRTAGGMDVVRMTPFRKAIARQLVLSKSTIPHFYLRGEINFDPLLTLRAEAKRASGSVPSLNDYCVRAAALALMQVTDVNVQVHGDDIHRFHSAHIAVAVATDRGLVAPVLRSAESKSVSVVSTEMKQLADRARNGKLSHGDFDGASFTISNLGMYGVDQFDAIINPPQGAILAIGAVRRRLSEVDGRPAFGNSAWISLSCDHRAIDGNVGARFLAALRVLLEAPAQL